MPSPPSVHSLSLASPCRHPRFRQRRHLPASLSAPIFRRTSEWISGYISSSSNCRGKRKSQRPTFGSSDLVLSLDQFLRQNGDDMLDYEELLMFVERPRREAGGKGGAESEADMYRGRGLLSKLRRKVKVGLRVATWSIQQSYFLSKEEMDRGWTGRIGYHGSIQHDLVGLDLIRLDRI